MVKMMSIEIGKNIVNDGSLEELQQHIQAVSTTPDKTQKEVQTEMNILLVRSLLAGRKDMFDFLATPQPPEDKPLAEISALDVQNINTYLTYKDINVADLPFRGMKEDSKPERLENSRDILNGLKEEKYGNDPKNIPLPLMAAFFAHVPLMKKLIEEKTINSQDWNFNQIIGKRPTTALDMAISLDVDEVNIYQNIAGMILEAGPQIGLDFTQHRSGVINQYCVGDLDKTNTYLEQLKMLPLGANELITLIGTTKNPIKKCISDDKNTGLMARIADKISTHISALKDQDSVMDKINEQAKEMASDIDLSLEESKLLSETFLKMLPNTEQFQELRGKIEGYQKTKEEQFELLRAGTPNSVGSIDIPTVATQRSFARRASSLFGTRSRADSGVDSSTRESPDDARTPPPIPPTDVRAAGVTAAPKASWLSKLLPLGGTNSFQQKVVAAEAAPEECGHPPKRNS
jgi:hypothetical protein